MGGGRRGRRRRLGGAAALGLGLICGCAKTIPELEHRSVLAAQQATYEEQLKRLAEEKEGDSATCARSVEDATGRSAMLGERISRLEGALADKQRLLDEATSYREVRGGRAEARSKGEARASAEVVARLRAIFTRGSEGLEGVAVEGAAGRVAIRLPGDRIFPAVSTRLEGAALEGFVALAGELRGLPGHAVKITVHTDAVRPADVSTLRDTWELAQRQGLAILRALVEAGVDPARLTLASAGGFHPVSTNETLEGRLANRRIEIELTPMLP